MISINSDSYTVLIRKLILQIKDVVYKWLLKEHQMISLQQINAFEDAKEI